MISMHTSRNGAAEQKIFQTKILMWMHSAYGQNILPEVPFPSLPPPRSSPLQAPLSWQELPGEHRASVASGRNHLSRNKPGRTSKGQGRLGCLELETRCMDSWGSWEGGGSWEPEQRALRSRVLYKEMCSSFKCKGFYRNFCYSVSFVITKKTHSYAKETAGL